MNTRDRSDGEIPIGLNSACPLLFYRVGADDAMTLITDINGVPLFRLEAVGGIRLVVLEPSIKTVHICPTCRQQVVHDH